MLGVRTARAPKRASGASFNPDTCWICRTGMLYPDWRCARGAAPGGDVPGGELGVLEDAGQSR